MSQSKRIVIDDFPAEKLPAELRGDIADGHRVRVIVEDFVKDEPRFRRFHGIAAEKNTSVEEAVARIRSQRDEWD